jgi:hypothetical protein
LLYVRRRRRSASDRHHSLSPTPSAQHGTARMSRGGSQARLSRTGSRSAVGNRRPRAPSNPQARPFVQAYGETSLAVPGSAYAQPTNMQTQPYVQAYGETSLAVPRTAYSQPMRPPARPPMQAYGETSLTAPRPAYTQTSLYPSFTAAPSQSGTHTRAPLTPTW